MLGAAALACLVSLLLLCWKGIAYNVLHTPSKAVFAAIWIGVHCLE